MPSPTTLTTTSTLSGGSVLQVPLHGGPGIPQQRHRRVWGLVPRTERVRTGQHSIAQHGTGALITPRLAVHGHIDMNETPPTRMHQRQVPSRCEVQLRVCGRLRRHWGPDRYLQHGRVGGVARA